MNRMLAVLVPLVGLFPAPAVEPVVPPSADALDKAEKLVKDVFRDEYAKKTPAAQLALAAKLLQQAAETTDDLAAKFVMYRESRDLAARAGDPAAAVKAVEDMARAFAVPAGEMKADTLEAAAKTIATTDGYTALVEQGRWAAEHAIAADEYDAASRLLGVAAGAAQKLKSAATAAEVVARAKDVEAIRQEFDRLRADFSVLKEKPKDAEAGPRVGRFLCLYKGRWETGLPLSARGGDEKLRELAKHDLANPDMPAARAHLADKWFELGEAQPDALLKDEAQLRALHWYRLASDGLTGLNKTKAEKRIAELAKVAARRKQPDPVGWFVVFRSDDASIWDTDANNGPNNRAVALKRVPANIEYLKLIETRKREFVVIPMTKERLGTFSEENGYGWAGDNKVTYKMNHLGIWNKAWLKPKKGEVVIHGPSSAKGMRGWGFGDRYQMHDRQGYSWEGEDISPTVFEVAVKAGPLTDTESAKLLYKKPK